MKRILKFLGIVQEVNNRNRPQKLGRGFLTAYRVNPYNPLSYLFIIIAAITGVIMFGFVGIWREIDYRNPFKWN